MLMFKRGGIVLLLISASACDTGNSTPTSPSPTPSAVPAPTPPPHTFVTSRLSGVVRDEQEQPVVGATVTVGTSAPVATDGNGFYTTLVTVDTFYRPPGLVTVAVRQSGYEDTLNYGTLPNFQDGRADFHLFTKPTLAAGSTATLLVAFDGRLCGLEDEYPCRHAEITAPASGTLTIDTAASDPMSHFVFGPVSYPFHSTAHAEVAVTAGQVIPVEIVWQWPGAAWVLSRTERFALTTSIRP